jgi:hypothetical protein
MREPDAGCCPFQIGTSDPLGKNLSKYRVVKLVIDV